MNQLGLELPFSDGGLRGIVDSTMDQNIHLSGIRHESFTQVNEEGTEAAAATAASSYCSRRLSQNKVKFVADHPFLFFTGETPLGTPFATLDLSLIHI